MNNNRPRGQQPSFKLHIDTQMLIEEISKTDYAQIVTYRALSELIGRDVQTEASGILRTALRHLERDEGMFFSCVRNIGLRRVTESEQLQSVPLNGRKKIRRAADTINRKLSYLPDDKLSREEQTQKLMDISFASTLKHAASERRVARIQEQAKGDTDLSPKKALELFRKAD
jgi:hypothetical protein